MWPAPRSVAALVSLLLVACGSARPPVDGEWTVRAEATAGAVQPLGGYLLASEDPAEGAGRGVAPEDLGGDRIALRGDADLRVGRRWGGGIEVRPTADDRLRLELDVAGPLRGRAHLDRDRRFDGERYAAGEATDADLLARCLRVSYGRRVAALGEVGEEGQTDLVVRVGAELLATDDAHVAGSASPEEGRQLRSGTPFLGVEARAALAPRVTFVGGLAGGAWSLDGGSRVLGDLNLGLLLGPVGPVDLHVGYGLGFRSSRKLYENHELSRVELLRHEVVVGLGVRY